MVEWKKLGDIIEYLPGGALKRNEVKEDGLYPVMNGGIDYSGYYDDYNYDENVLTVSHWGSSASHIHRHNGKFWANNACWVFVPNNEAECCIQYLYQVLKERENIMMQTMCFGGATPNLNRFLFEKQEIPLPALDEQQRIVDALDTFTSSIENLKRQIAQRRKQYSWFLDQAYYPNKYKLLEAAERGEVKVKTFDEIGTFTRGRRFVRTDIVSEGVPCIHYGDMYTYYGVWADKTPTHLTKDLAAKLRFASKGDVIIVGAGENDMDIGVGVAWLGEEDVVVHDACYIFKHEINPQYISYYLRSMNYHLQIKMGVVDSKICSISAKELGRTLIPIPSISEQQRIVSILDTFEASIANLEAQLAQREKQYEYYRNKLLTFE